MNVLRALAALSLFAVPVAIATTASADGGDVKEANETCYTATAILLGGDGNDESTRVDMIRRTIERGKKWTIVSEPPNNRWGEVALVKFDVKTPYKGGPTVAYTVQCGHGGTCNEVAKAFRKDYPTLTPAPVVTCGDVSAVLVNPQVIK